MASFHLHNRKLAKSAKSDRTVGNIDSEIFATPAPSVSQDKMLENIIKVCRGKNLQIVLSIINVKSFWEYQIRNE
jgi:hypothetical protein